MGFFREDLTRCLDMNTLAALEEELLFWGPWIVFRVFTCSLQVTFPLSLCILMACGPIAFIRFPEGSMT